LSSCDSLVPGDTHLLLNFLVSHRRTTQLITADKVHLLPGFPVEENSALKVAFYILLPSFLQSSGIIPAAALEQVVNNVKSDLESALGFNILR